MTSPRFSCGQRGGDEMKKFLGTCPHPWVQFPPQMGISSSAKGIIMRKQLKSWIEKFYGKRCKEYVKSCACCEAWKCYDRLMEVYE